MCSQCVRNFEIFTARCRCLAAFCICCCALFDFYFSFACLPPRRAQFCSFLFVSQTPSVHNITTHISASMSAYAICHACTYMRLYSSIEVFKYSNTEVFKHSSCSSICVFEWKNIGERSELLSGRIVTFFFYPIITRALEKGKKKRFYFYATAIVRIAITLD